MITSRNEILTALPAAELAALEPHMRRTLMPRNTILHGAGAVADKVYFPEVGAVSLVTELLTGEVIECALIGVDGVVGGFSALHGRPSLNKGIVQIDSSGFVIAAEPFRRVATSGSALNSLVELHNQFLHAQAQQSAACNAAHPLEARLARWLLRAHDLCGKTFSLTQEAVAAFLGVRRTSVSLTAHALQDLGMIRYRRGSIEILDLKRLQQASCECHLALREQGARLRYTQPDDRASANQAG